MREDGTVSLWVGKAYSEEEVEAYVEIPYIEDDDEIHTSRFGENFKI
ncbi:hypothetical protein J2Z44_001713 [Clostridium punense]|uniref:Uncharacterized protein n=1 Tax=Clostridium punense TaxID=1054297 RepID=A0ABS4K2A5_9CLOT|nr:MULTISPECIES: immunity 22 family protein [Clostridium]EQB90156.1 hypothetical protein M918_01350 [Clostridium sp. BL8]MBP2021917.1 hypothetical protein [Clostridium punense]